MSDFEFQWIKSFRCIRWYFEEGGVLVPEETMREIYALSELLCCLVFCVSSILRHRQLSTTLSQLGLRVIFFYLLWRRHLFSEQKTYLLFFFWWTKHDKQVFFHTNSKKINIKCHGTPIINKSINIITIISKIAPSSHWK